LADPEWFFQLWMFCIFLFWIDTIIHVLPEASIREITGCANPKIYRKRQSKNLPDFIIWNTKKNVQFIEGQFCLSATLWGCRKKNAGVQEETAHNIYQTSLGPFQWPSNFTICTTFLISTSPSPSVLLSANPLLFYTPSNSCFLKDIKNKK